MRGSASQRSHHAALQGLLALDRLVRRLLVGIAPLQLRRRRPLLGSALVARRQRREVAQHLATLADRAPRAWQADRRRQRVLARGGSDEERELVAELRLARGRLLCRERGRDRRALVLVVQRAARGRRRGARAPARLVLVAVGLVVLGRLLGRRRGRGGLDLVVADGEGGDELMQRLALQLLGALVARPELGLLRVGHHLVALRGRAVESPEAVGGGRLLLEDNERLGLGLHGVLRLLLLRLLLRGHLRRLVVHLRVLKVRLAALADDDPRARQDERLGLGVEGRRHADGAVRLLERGLERLRRLERLLRHLQAHVLVDLIPRGDLDRTLARDGAVALPPASGTCRGHLNSLACVR